jgi:hypothetical protein
MYMEELSANERCFTKVARFVHAGTAATVVEVITGAAVGDGSVVNVAVGTKVAVGDGSGVLVGTTTAVVGVVCPTAKFPLDGSAVAIGDALFEEQALKKKKTTTKIRV